ncbi:hypothetical protein N1851_026403 [Merluccius polli]|uniref:Uncharacterized protein n=1 Tax=Merluccius polli TaxID=89951 RepID=A0AA47MBU2_MERPO|nr:hypothetical protein N1851_026403 [Merluccius polli]
MTAPLGVGARRGTVATDRKEEPGGSELRNTHFDRKMGGVGQVVLVLTVIWCHTSRLQGLPKFIDKQQNQGPLIEAINEPLDAETCGDFDYPTEEHIDSIMKEELSKYSSEGAAITKAEANQLESNTKLQNESLVGALLMMGDPKVMLAGDQGGLGSNGNAREDKNKENCDQTTPFAPQSRGREPPEPSKLTGFTSARSHGSPGSGKLEMSCLGACGFSAGEDWEGAGEGGSRQRDAGSCWVAEPGGGGGGGRRGKGRSTLRIRVTNSRWLLMAPWAGGAPCVCFLFLRRWRWERRKAQAAQQHTVASADTPTSTM